MVRKRNTKRALVCSIVMLLLSYTMLLGTTFAWFTVSVSSGITPIRAGNLSVAMDYAVQPVNGGALVWQPATNLTVDLFGSDTFWEPGFTGVVYLRVRNTGSLALKYKYTIEVAENQLGKNGKNEPIDLTNFIKLAVKEGTYKAKDTDCQPLYNSRGDAKDEFSSPEVGFISSSLPAAESGMGMTGIAYTSTSTSTSIKSLMPQDAANDEDKSTVIAVVVHMPENVGNAANHNGQNQPSIRLKVKLDATQFNSESDSFDSDYDANATYPPETTADTAEGE